MTSRTLEEIALSYAERFKWPVLALHWPVDNGCSCKDGIKCESIGKHPQYHREDLLHGCHSATTDPEIIRCWYKRWPQANIGIATGEQSFDVLDADVHPEKGINGNDTLDDLQAKYGKLPDTVEQLTGGGGRQILFMHDDRIDNRVKFAPGLDTRSTGGLVVVPPSLHASGQRYQWELSSMPGEVPLAVWPSWLVKIIVEAQNKAGNNGSKSNSAGWEIEPLKGVAKGERDHTATRLAGLYLTKQLKPLEIFYLLSGWNLRNTPPLPQEQIAKVVRSVLQSHKRNHAGDKNHGRRIKISIG